VKNKTLLIVLALWTGINLLQSHFTGLFHDEALYWLCAQHLDWGFWDHPPAAPLLIFLGYELIPSELGVRLFITLASTATVYGLWRLVRPSDPRLFFALVFSIFLVHIGGFMAAPDIPLLLCTVWFLVWYREYLRHDHWLHAIGLGVLVAAMAYSKYHGAVFLFFALLGRLAILRRASFWIIPVLALVLFSPHLYWQWTHGFPTFRYHLIDRAGDTYRWTFITDYLGGQLLVLGPFVSILLLLAAWRFRPESAFERVLKWSFWGVMAFFLYQSFNQRTEANWTATAIIPLVYLSYHTIVSRPLWRKWLYGLALPSFLLIALFRLDLMTAWLPDSINPRREFWGWDRWAQDVSDRAGDRPVLFLNTYRMPAKFQFYTGLPAYSLSMHGHAGNQFTLFPDQEAAYQGREVFIASGELKEGEVFHPGGITTMKYRVVEDFRSFNRVSTRVIGAPEALPADTLVSLQLAVENLSGFPLVWEEGSREVDLEYWVFRENDLVLTGTALAVFPEAGLAPGEVQLWQVRLQTPEQPGSYRFRYQFTVEDLFSGRSGNFCKLEVY
jgi:hypothetical protein